MKTLPPSGTESAAVETFERLIAQYGEAQARLRNLQSANSKKPMAVSAIMSISKITS